MTETHAESSTRGPNRRGGWYVTDAELIEIIGVPEKEAYRAIHKLDADPRSGFPKKQELWGGRRYLPAVKAYFDATNGLIGAARLIPENREPHSAAASYNNRAVELQRRSHGHSSSRS